MKADIHFDNIWLNSFWNEIVSDEVVEEIKTGFMPKKFSQKSYRLWDNVGEKKIRYGPTLQYNAAQKRCALHAG